MKKLPTLVAPVLMMSLCLSASAAYAVSLRPQMPHAALDSATQALWTR